MLRNRLSKQKTERASGYSENTMTYSTVIISSVCVCVVARDLTNAERNTRRR